MFRCVMLLAALLVAGCDTAIEVTTVTKRPAGFVSDTEKHQLVANEIGRSVVMTRQEVLKGSGLDVAAIARRRLAAAGYYDMVCRQKFTIGATRVLYVTCARDSKLDQYLQAPHTPAFTLRLQPLRAHGMTAPLLVDTGWGIEEWRYRRYW